LGKVVGEISGAGGMTAFRGLAAWVLLASTQVLRFAQDDNTFLSMTR